VGGAFIGVAASTASAAAADAAAIAARGGPRAVGAVAGGVPPTASADGTPSGGAEGGKGGAGGEGGSQQGGKQQGAPMAEGGKGRKGAQQPAANAPGAAAAPLRQGGAAPNAAPNGAASMPMAMAPPNASFGAAPPNGPNFQGRGGYPPPGYPGVGAPLPHYAAQFPAAAQQMPTEVMLLQGDERIRAHRDALKQRLSVGSLLLEELEYAVRLMIMSGRFIGAQGMLPETMLMPQLPDKYLAPPSPFRTIADLASSLPWLLRVHQSMQWVQQMPNGLMTVQRLICPAASEMGGLAAPDGVLSVDWPKVEEVMNRPTEAPAQSDYRPSMAGDPRFPRAPNFTGAPNGAIDGAMVVPGGPGMIPGAMGPMSGAMGPMGGFGAMGAGGPGQMGMIPGAPIDVNHGVYEGGAPEPSPSPTGNEKTRRKQTRGGGGGSGGGGNNKGKGGGKDPAAATAAAQAAAAASAKSAQPKPAGQPKPAATAAPPTALPPPPPPAPPPDAPKGEAPTPTADPAA
jgi:hypothetical protein